MCRESQALWLESVARLSVESEDGADDLIRRLARLAGDRPLEPEQGRLLAAVYPRLRRSTMETTLTGAAGKAYLANWTSNLALLERAAPVIRGLVEGGCVPVLLKGTALVLKVFRDLGLRALSDVDVLVDSRRLETAWQILRQQGGVPEQRGAIAGLEACWNAGHAWAFEFPRGWSLDLHWSPLVDCCSVAVARRFTAGAAAVSLAGAPVLVPSREHLLLHACVHGVRRDWLAPGRWLIDAATVIRGTPGLDWAVVVGAAEEAGLGHALHFAVSQLDALSLLGEEGRAAALHRRPSLYEQLELWAWRRDQLSWTRAPLPRVLTHLARYRRLRRFHPGWRQRTWKDYLALYRAEKALL